jgi:WD repeat-containing protein 19
MRPLFSISSTQHGSAPVIFSWHPDSTYLASCGSNRIVHIVDRYGEPVDDVRLEAAGPCTALEWDHEGETLAIMQKEK